MKIILHANDDMTRMKGLMFHRPITHKECAFFTFQREGQHSFWNKNVDFPISLIFCDKEGVVRDIKKLGAQQLEGVRPESYDIKYVIEAHENAPVMYGIKMGKKIKLKDDEVDFDD